MNITLQLEYRTRFGENLYLNLLNERGGETAHAMHTLDGIVWSVSLDADPGQLARRPVDYYYSVEEGGQIKRTEWVLGTHHLTPDRLAGQATPLTLTDHWADPQADYRIAGTSVPLFSLRSRRSFGVGDFGDLRLMVDWVAKTGQHLLQLLPLNDTTATHTRADSYPYSSISAFALHPQYIDLNQLPPLADAAERRRFEQLRRRLNDLPEVDYEAVNRAKTDYLRLLFRQDGRQVLRSEGFKRFFQEAEGWLVPYARFCCLRDQHGTADFSRWPDHPTFSQSERPQLANPRTRLYREAAFWYYVQYLLHTQLCSVHDHARRLGVMLKGDLPIGVSRTGCDAWQHPRYFNRDGQAGAPPDAFSADGQNWGFPTYNWTALMADGCRWWEQRFRHLANYFDAYRIDHVLGFFRIWEIPFPCKSGLMGQFSPALPLSRDELAAAGLSAETVEQYTAPELWQRQGAEVSTDCLFLHDHRNPALLHPRINAWQTQAYQSLPPFERDAFDRVYEDFFYHRHNHWWQQLALQKLTPLVRATRMLCCAEDLGMVPACVPEVMSQLQMLSLELESMPKQYGTRFGHAEHNPYLSVCTLSTHDTPTLRQWWDEDAERTADYLCSVLHTDAPATHPLNGAMARRVVEHHLTSPSMLCIVSLQDWLAMDESLRLPDPAAERVNNPANPYHYWGYRMHLTLEDLLHSPSLNTQINTLITRSHRS